MGNNKALNKCLKKNTSLNLGWNYPSDECIATAANALKKCPFSL